jgi:hypothetical protein
LIQNKQNPEENIINLPLETSIVEGNLSKGAKEIELKEVLEGAKDIFVESYNGSEDMIELNGEDVEEIIDILRGLQLEKTKETRVDELYDYVLHVKNSKMKIKIGNPYIFIEDMSENRLVFQGEEKHIEELETWIEAIYMSKYQKSDLFANPESITVIAEDEGYQWDVAQETVEAFMNQISLTSPVNEGEAAFALAEYPDYRIQIKTDQQTYNIHLMNKDLLTVDSQNQFSYYQYDRKLWDFILKKYPVQLKAASTDLKSLLGAKSINIDDHKDMYDLVDDQYYHRAIARTILRGKPKEVSDMDQQLPLVFILTFEIGGKNKVVYVYNDYIVFEGRSYFIQRIDEAIRSTVGVY